MRTPDPNTRYQRNTGSDTRSQRKHQIRTLDLRETPDPNTDRADIRRNTGSEHQIAEADMKRNTGSEHRISEKHQIRTPHLRSGYENTGSDHQIWRKPYPNTRYLISEKHQISKKHQYRYQIVHQIRTPDLRDTTDPNTRS